MMDDVREVTERQAAKYNNLLSAGNLIVGGIVAIIGAAVWVGMSVRGAEDKIDGMKIDTDKLPSISRRVDRLDDKMDMLIPDVPKPRDTVRKI